MVEDLNGGRKMNVIRCPFCNNKVDLDVSKCACGGKKPITKLEEKKETKK